MYFTHTHTHTHSFIVIWRCRSGQSCKKNGTAVKAMCRGNLTACHFGHAYNGFASPALHFWLYNASTKYAFVDSGEEGLQ